MNPNQQHDLQITRRNLLLRSGYGAGAAALSTLLNPALLASESAKGFVSAKNGGLPGLPHFAPKAKRVIYLFMAGGPSHIDTWDYKPALEQLHGQELPDSVRGGQRITGMTSGQKSFPVVKSHFDYSQHGQCGRWVSSLLPYTAGIVDDIAVVKSLNTEAVNHDPAITFINTGTQQPGKPSMGAWLSYGLGSANQNMPAYIVMISRGKGNLQALYSRLWGSGFLPAEHQGVKLRGSGDPILYLANPNGITRGDRRHALDTLARLNAAHHDRFGDPEIQARISQYEMAFRMQAEAPELCDTSNEPDHIYELYGQDSRTPGTFAANCIRARRLAESGVRFIQLFHRGWDQHGNLKKSIAGQCKDVDQASAALVNDLKQRGMLDDTLIVWGGEFGRTVYQQGTDFETGGRDHHGRCFSIWMAGAGIKGGIEYGMTDDHCYNIVENPVHIRDLNATILDRLGINHERLTFNYQGLDQRLTGVEPAHVVKDLLA
jgi:hypothetical protein